MARTPGSLNAQPGKAAIKSYYRFLRDAAGNGDVLAMGLMIIATKIEQLSPEPAAKSGWKGDAGDPYQQILQAIRENNPDSEQLPKSNGPKVR